MARRLLVIGAGPIGIAAALEAAKGGFDVTVLERGEPGDSLRRWGPTRFFTPVGMNISPQFRSVLNGALPPDEAMLTGPEFADRVLRPLIQREPLRGRILTHHQVLAVGRRGLGKSDFAGHPLRAERPFRVIARTAEGEGAFEADVVLDASGGYAIPAHLGSGSLPALGETSAEALIIRDLGTLHRDLPALTEKRVLLVGHGHSAANAIAWLTEEDQSTRITWSVRTANRRPCSEVACDPLPERRSVVAHANDLAESPPSSLSVRRKTTIDQVALHDGRALVTFSDGTQDTFDRIVALTGYRPDCSFLSELNVELSPFSDGTARLHRAIASVTDCLSIPRVQRPDLETGEPGFYLIGSKSYGRSRSFLLKNGLAHLQLILEGL